MKRVITSFAAVLLTVIMWAQSPEKISYQAVIRDGDGSLASNQSIGMQISIIQGSENGTEVYVERHFPTSNSNGLVSIVIGDGIVTSGSFTAIDWVNGPYFFKTETDLLGGANYTITGTSQLLSVPYAMSAKTAENVFSGDYNDLKNKPTMLSSFENDEGYISGNGSDVEISGDYLYDSPKEKYLSFSSHHFTADDPDIPINRTNTRYLYFSSGSGIATASAPVNLPDGAVVTSVTAYLLDNDPLEESNLFLRWYKHDDTFGTMGFCGTSSAESSSTQFV